MNPTSAQHAALRLLLEDVDPLLQRAEEAALTLTKVREELHADLTTLGGLVQQSLDSQPLLLEAGRKLSTSAARIEAAMNGADLPLAKRGKKRAGWRHWIACMVSAALSAIAVSATCWIATRNVASEARIGRALMSVWPSMDAATRSKLQEQLGKF